jgi:hypothetical protein
MSITTEEAEQMAEICDQLGGFAQCAAALRSLAAERDALRSENEKLRAALRFYAGDEPWKWTSEDYGKVARAALGEKE